MSGPFKKTCQRHTESWLRSLLALLTQQGSEPLPRPPRAAEPPRRGRAAAAGAAPGFTFQAAVEGAMRLEAERDVDRLFELLCGGILK